MAPNPTQSSDDRDPQIEAALAAIYEARLALYNIVHMERKLLAEAQEIAKKALPPSWSPRPTKVEGSPDAWTPRG